MAWIESHQELESHPKVIELGGMMDWDLDQTIGKLHRFWWWCMKFAESGDLRRYNDGQLAASVALNRDDGKKFVEAMVTCGGPVSGFIERVPYFRVHDWWDYAGPFLLSKYKHRPEKWKEIKDLYQVEEQDKNSSKNSSNNWTPNQPNQPNQPNTPQPPEGERVRPRSRQKKKFEHDSVPYQAAKFFADEYLKAWAPTAIVTENDLQNWAEAADGMFRLDHRLPDDFNDLLDWLNDQKPSGPSGFLWRNNIRSLDTLRKRWKEGKFAGWLAPSLRKDEFR